MAEKEIISSSENNDQFFEGVEKLIEIWFTPEKNADLRKISRKQWENVLKIVRCEIISFTQSEQVDAYVLSESSMFVSRRRFILKTCGTTTPLRCVRAVLALARDVAGHSRVHNVFYSRREFARPRAQHHPHHCFDSEVPCIQPAGDTYTHSSMLHAARRRHSRVHNVFYSRREFARPRAQHHPHHCFDS
ncbi:adenosylmethionine decarboxylase domain-containing protein [Phthorimaea operculella]|nr:adenosylmethionine decarboxylase domain-containing protein [Phthorimaea operculella]